MAIIIRAQFCFMKHCHTRWWPPVKTWLTTPLNLDIQWYIYIYLFINTYIYIYHIINNLKLSKYSINHRIHLITFLNLTHSCYQKSVYTLKFPFLSSVRPPFSLCFHGFSAALSQIDTAPCPRFCQCLWHRALHSFGALQGGEVGKPFMMVKSPILVVKSY